MKKLLVMAISCGALFACNSKPNEQATIVSDSAAVKETKAPAQAEIGDAKFAEIGKNGLAKLSSGDIDGWMNDFADNAAYRWSSGDSLIGKAAISTYWKERRNKIIDSITFSMDIWQPLKVNTPQRGPDAAGNWLLGWYIVHTKYTNGKSVDMWVHTDFHFDANDKIDQVIQYIDRAPINRALGIK